MKTIKLKIILCCCCAVLLTACWPRERGFGIPDPLANDNINQLIRKGPDWKQIVQDKTLFVLGEADSEPYETYTHPNHTRYIRYNHSYGTFPAIDGSTVLLPMGAEFVWQFTNLRDHSDFAGQNETLTFLNFSTTAGAYNRIINGEQTNGVIYRRISNSEIKEYHFRKRPDIVLATYPSSAELKMATDAGVELIIEPQAGYVSLRDAIEKN